MAIKQLSQYFCRNPTHGIQYGSSHEIEFKEVSFAYGDHPVLKHISFVVKENSITALVGKSGCGKTTMCNLIARFWDCEAGQILLGGVDIREMAFKQLISNITMVFQRVYLFHDTVYDNIAFGNANATREQVIEAAKKARCHDFIMEMPDGQNIFCTKTSALFIKSFKSYFRMPKAP